MKLVIILLNLAQGRDFQPGKDKTREARPDRTVPKPINKITAKVSMMIQQRATATKKNININIQVLITNYVTVKMMIETF